MRSALASMAVSSSSGLGYILNSTPYTINTRYTKALVRERINNIEHQEWCATTTESGHCSSYNIFKNSLNFEKYLTILNPKEASDMCRFRCGNHKLPVVMGRYNRVEKSKRICTLCDSNEIGDEFHYIFVCNALTNERFTYISRQLPIHQSRSPDYHASLILGWGRIGSR